MLMGPTEPENCLLGMVKVTDRVGEVSVGSGRAKIR